MKARRAFTLIELLTAMAILTIIALMLAMIFADTDRIWFLGSGRAVNALNGRAAMNLVSHDLQYAVADNVLTFYCGPDRYKASIYGFTNDEVCAVSLQNDSSDGERAVREVFYYVKTNKNIRAPGTLMRGYYSSAISTSAVHCYYNRSWFENPPSGVGRPPEGTGPSQPIAENVTAFSVAAPYPFPPFPSGYGCDMLNMFYDSRAFSNQLPEYADVYLEILNDLQVAQLTNIASATERKAFLERNARRYVNRVYFQNRMGYKPR